MIHPVDLTTKRVKPSPPSSAKGNARWREILALAIIAALLVTAVLVFARDERVPQQPERPQLTEAPLDARA